MRTKVREESIKKREKRDREGKINEMNFFFLLRDREKKERTEEKRAGVKRREKKSGDKQ